MWIYSFWVFELPLFSHLERSILVKKELEAASCKNRTHDHLVLNQPSWPLNRSKGPIPKKCRRVMLLFCDTSVGCVEQKSFKAKLFRANKKFLFFWKFLLSASKLVLSRKLLLLWVYGATDDNLCPSTQLEMGPVLNRFQASGPWWWFGV